MITLQQVHNPFIVKHTAMQVVTLVSLVGGVIHGLKLQPTPWYYNNRRSDRYASARSGVTFSFPVFVFLVVLSSDVCSERRILLSLIRK